MVQTASLDYLLGAYFHQDFDLDGTVPQIIDAFVRSDPEDAKRVPGEIDEKLRTHRDEADLAAYIESVKCEYAAQPDEGGYRGWLTSIAQRIRSAI